MKFFSNFFKNKWVISAYALTAVYISLYLIRVFSSEFIVQDDARAHVLWAYKYLSPGYFNNNDIMLEYFEAMAPYGYWWLYHSAAWLGVSPFLLNKLLPVILGLATCYYAFRLANDIFKNPLVAFVATLILNHILWGQDNLPSGTPRAFIYPLLLASMVYMLRRAFWSLVLTFILEASFYPHALFISFVTYGLTFFRRNGRLVSVSQNRRDYVNALFIAGICLVALLPYVLKTHDFGPLVNYRDAIKLPEFQQGGRSAFFYSSKFKYWFSGRRSGMWPSSIGLLANVCLILSLAFPYVWRRRELFGISNSANVGILYRLVLASLLMFFLAHLMLFHLHLPSRFTQHSFRIVVAMIGAQVLVASATYMWGCIRRQTCVGIKRVGAYLLLSLYGWLLAYPLVLMCFGVDIIKGANFIVGKQPGLYRFFSAQPRDSVIAALSRAADLIPSFSLRSVVYAREYAIAYHRGYYTELERRRNEMETAYTTNNALLLTQFIDHYKVSHFVVDEVVKQRWTQRAEAYPEPFLSKIASQCSVYRGDGAEVVDAACIKANI